MKNKTCGDVCVVNSIFVYSRQNEHLYQEFLNLIFWKYAPLLPFHQMISGDFLIICYQTSPIQWLYCLNVGIFKKRSFAAQSVMSNICNFFFDDLHVMMKQQKEGQFARFQSVGDVSEFTYI